MSDGWFGVDLDGTLAHWYAACWRVAQVLGYRRCVTYILDSEHGASVTAAGWRCVGKTSGGSWSCPSRPRVDKHPTQMKLRFEIETAAAGTVEV